MNELTPFWSLHSVSCLFWVSTIFSAASSSFPSVFSFRILLRHEHSDSSSFVDNLNGFRHQPGETLVQLTSKSYLRCVRSALSHAYLVESAFFLFTHSLISQ